MRISILLLIGFTAAVPLFGADANAHVLLDERHKVFFQHYCVACHGEQKQKGKFRADTLAFSITTVESADRWQKILNALNSGDMPPEDAKQPDKAAKVELLDGLAKALVAARKALSDQGGRITMRRLNRREYKNTIRDLLGVDLNVSELPADGGAGSFDTVGSGLFMSSDQFEEYQALGRQAFDEAWARYKTPSPIRKVHIEAEAGTVERVRKSLAERIENHRRYKSWTADVDAASKHPENREALEFIRKEHPGDSKAVYLYWEKLKGAPSPTQFGLRDAIDADQVGASQWDHDVPNQTAWLVQPETKTGVFISVYDNAVCPAFDFNVGADWPAGDYVVRVRVAATDKAPKDRRFLEFGIRGDGGVFSRLSTHHVLGTMATLQVLEIPVKLPAAGGRSFYVTEIGLHDDFGDKSLRIFNDAKQRNGVGPEFNLWIDWVEVEGPLQPSAVPIAMPVMKLLMSVNATKISSSEVHAAIEQFATLAFRGRQPGSPYIDRLTKIFEARRKAGDSAEVAIKETLAVILASPHFLYLSEPNDAENSRELSGLELATRLSYFLWSAPPDSTLLDLAQRGELKKPEVLLLQIDRMLSDTRSYDFVTGFTHQWLNLDRLDFFQFNSQLYPDFDKSTQSAAKEEVFRTVAFLLKDDQSLARLLKSDFVVVNGLLANYYGIEGVSGDDFLKVALPNDSPRGGLTGMAVILAMGSNGERTSPVERGAWVLRKLLNDPPPPAPPNVPQISRLDGKLLTTRERMLAHQEQPQCASCHRKIDPIGFGFENFNAAGKWRVEETLDVKGVGKKTWAIDPSGAFHKGPAFKDFFEMRDLIAARQENFAHGFAEALIEYALGRPCGFSDEPLLENMLRRARGKNFSVREYIHALISSREFQGK